MPGISTHMAIADLIADQLNEETNVDELKKIIQNHEDFFKMGSLGPDMLFFAPDYGDEIKSVLEDVVGFYDNFIQPIEELYEDYIQPVMETIDEVVDVADKELFCSTINTVGNELGVLMDRIFQDASYALMKRDNQYVDIFDMMQPAVQKGEDEKTWYWFDMLHYRKTGDFTKNMWQIAQTDKQKAYVLGYLTHIATDITGHPFVNTAVGGPARSHNQRHHFVENMIDTWVYREIFDTRYTNSKLHRQLPRGKEDFDDSGLGIFASILRHADEIPSELKPIFDMTHNALKNTFTEEPIPERLQEKYLTQKDFNFAYYAILGSLKSSTNSFIPKPSPPTEGMVETIEDAISQFLNHASNPPTNHADNSNMCYSFWKDDCNFSVNSFKNFLENVWENITYLGELVLWVGELLKDIWNIIACTATAPIKLLVKSLLWIAHSALHDLSQELKHYLVLSALIPPEPEWMENNPLAQSSVKLKERSRNYLFSGKEYPHRAQESNEGFLNFPTTQIEHEATIPGPYNYNSTPVDFILNTRDNDGMYDKYLNSDSAEETKNLERRNSFKSIGSSIDLSIELMKELINNNNIPNWNLDADRGFAYKTWEVVNTNGSNPLAWNQSFVVKDKFI